MFVFKLSVREGDPLQWKMRLPCEKYKLKWFKKKTFTV